MAIISWKNYQNNMISIKAIGHEAFLYKFAGFFELATKNADISKNWLFKWNFFHHSKHYRLPNKCAKFQAESFRSWHLTKVGKFSHPYVLTLPWNPHAQ